MAASKARQVQIATRRTQAVQLRLAGTDWETIATKLGYADRGSACKDVSRALDAHVAELRGATEELRALQVARVDRLLAAIWPKALKGDPASITTALRLLDRHAKLMGLDEPSRVSVDAQQLGAEIGDLLNALNQGAAEQGTDDDDGTGD